LVTGNNKTSRYTRNNQFKEEIMRQFFKFLLASILGVFLAFLIFFLVFLGIISSIGSRDPKPVAANSVLHLQLTNEIVDRGIENPFESFDVAAFRVETAIGLNNLLLTIRKAKEDDNIKGIYLDLTVLQTGWSTVGEIRNQLLDFKESGKFIIAHSDIMTQGAYYLASVADEVYLSPYGVLDFRGINAQVLFVKNMLEKIGVEVEVVRHGKYKGAGEMFFRENLSPENREQILGFTSSIWNAVLTDISQQRGLTINQLHDVANRFLTRTPEGALEAGMIDGILYRDEVMDNLREKLGVESNRKVNLVNYSNYRRAPLPDSMIPAGRRDKIAIVYGSGNVVMGEGSDRSMGGDRIAEALRTARLDTTIRAIVFRINTPGGAVIASDIMLREAILAAEAKPVVVSMGDVAASAGYYVASYAHKIIASPTTITGSIGVFGIVPNMNELLNDKLGITFDNVKTNDLADFGSFNRAMTRTERFIIQESIERFYQNFINHVATGRQLPLATVDSIAQGRVWSAIDAHRIGLVDDFGGLNYAIEQAALLAGIENYRIVEYPVVKSFAEQIRDAFGTAKASIVRSAIGQENFRMYEQVQRVTENSGVLMRLPYDITLE
jgi:protease IV